jgi:hypothetical protein
MTKASKSSFAPVATKIRHRTIGRSYGEVGTGKTRFWLLAPKPLYIQSLDKGLEGTIDQLIREGLIRADDVHVADYDWHPGSDDFSQSYAVNLRDRLIADHNFALENEARTIVWDKESDIWELFRYAEFGSPNDTPKDYQKLNQRYMAIINKVKGYDASLGLIQSMKDKWGLTGEVNQRTGKKSFGKTGEREAWGFDRLEEQVFVNICHRREDGEFFLDIGKCRQNTALQDQTLPATTFADFGMMLIEGSNESDWA